MGADEVTGQVFRLFDLYGHNDYLGEKVTQVQHMVQCAMLAEQEDGSAEVRMRIWIYFILCPFLSSPFFFCQIPFSLRLEQVPRMQRGVFLFLSYEVFLLL